jgi:2-dehydropantoate 2-reductase
MRFLVIGAGAIGGYLGGKLQRGGADVTFLVRPRRAAQLADRGLVVKAQDEEIRAPAQTVLAGQVEGPYDVILLCCKAYDLEGAMAAMAPAVGPGSAIVPFLNGVRHLSLLAERFGAEQVLGGLIAVNAVLKPDGDVVQTPVKIDMTAFGEPTGRHSDRCAEIHRAFTAGGVPIAVSDDIVAFMWSKFFAFACIAAVATLTRARAGAIAASAAGASFVSAAIEECGRVVAAEGYPPPAAAAEIVRGLYTQPRSSYGPSMLVDMEEGRPTEGEHTIGDLVSRAARRGMPTPILTAALCSLQAYELARQPGGRSPR